MFLRRIHLESLILRPKKKNRLIEKVSSSTEVNSTIQYNVSAKTNIKKECFSMKIITQISLFDDTQNENLGDLERLWRVIGARI